MQKLGRYKFGFSWKGLVLYLLQALPNIFWVTMPPTNDVLVANADPYPVLDIAEYILGISIIFLLVLLCNQDSSPSKYARLYRALAVAFLLAYYVGWIFYYRGIVSPGLLIGVLVASPPIYFFFSGLWLKNHIVSVLSIPFLFFHVLLGFLNYT